MRQLGIRLGRPMTGIAPEAMAALVRYHWPGNIRELRNALERALILEDGHVLTTRYLADARETGPAAVSSSASSGDGFRLPEGGVSLERVEETLVRQAMAMAGGNQTKAAKLLDVSRDTLRYKLKKHGLVEREPGEGDGGVSGWSWYRPPGVGAWLARREASELIGQE